MIELKLPISQNPNLLHEYLLINNIKPVSFLHDAEYNENGEKIKEATEANISVLQSEKEICLALIKEFNEMNSKQKNILTI